MTRLTGRVERFKLAKSWKPVASPRNYVQMESASVTGFDERSFVRAVLEGRLYGTTGPILEMTLEGVGLGGTHRGSSGSLRGRVRAAGWVPISRLRVYVSGESVATIEISPDEPFEIPLRFERDGFVTVEVSGEASDLFAIVVPGVIPFAFSNPIWVDADADGQWMAPGLGP